MADIKSYKTNWVVYYENDDWDTVKDKSTEILSNVRTKEEPDNLIQYVYLGIKQKATLVDEDSDEIHQSWYLLVRLFCFFFYSFLFLLI